MGCNMNDGMNCNMNRNVCRNTNCNMNRNMGRGNCNTNRNMGGSCNTREAGNSRNNNSQERKDSGCVGTTNVNCGCRMDGCDIGTEPVDKMAPGMSYVPWQKWKDIYCMEKALERGTIFEQLDKPFMGGRVR